LFETNDGRNLSFKINVKTKEEKEKLVKLLSKKHLTLTRLNGEQVTVVVKNDSTHSFILRKGQTEPDEYQFSIDLEVFEGKTETEKMAAQVEDKQEISYLSLYISVVLRDFLIEKGILSKEEFNSRMKAVEKEMKEKMQKSIEKETDKK
jgi:phenylpyruvate tautomerase PptA (4-oxalocrotonate tautomerase family)